MKSRAISYAILGTILSGLATSNISLADIRPNSEPISSTERETASILADMIERGLIEVDPETGLLRARTSVVNILEEYGLLKVERSAPMRIAGPLRCGNGRSN